jgi:hypothetical protein
MARVLSLLLVLGLASSAQAWWTNGAGGFWDCVEEDDAKVAWELTEHYGPTFPVRVERWTDDEIRQVWTEEAPGDLPGQMAQTWYATFDACVAALRVAATARAEAERRRERPMRLMLVLTLIALGVVLRVAAYALSPWLPTKEWWEAWAERMKARDPLTRWAVALGLLSTPGAVITLVMAVLDRVL